VRKDSGPKPPSTLLDKKDKPVYTAPENIIDRGAERRRALAIQKLEDVFGYGIRDEINFDDYEVTSFIETTPADQVKSHTPSMVINEPFDPVVVAEQQRINARYGPDRYKQLPDPFAPMPVPPVISGEVE
jgi:hypothetical protein